MFCLHSCAPYVCLVPTRGCLISRNYGWSVSRHVDPRNWTQVAGRATNALNCWTISPGSQQPRVVMFYSTVGKFLLTVIHYIFHKELEESRGPKHKGMSMCAMQMLFTMIWSWHMAYMCWVITLPVSTYNYCVPYKINELFICLCPCVCKLSYAGSGPFSEWTNSCQDEGGTARQVGFTLLTLSPCPYCSLRLIGTPSFLTNG